MNALLGGMAFHTYSVTLNVVLLGSVWVAFGTRNKFRYIPDHDISQSLGQHHKIFSFSKRSPYVIMKDWNTYPEATDASCPSCQEVMPQCQPSMSSPS